MQRSKVLAQGLVSLLLGFLLIASACGGGSGGGNPPPPPGGQTAPVSLALTDAPPAGVTVLSFEVLVNQATLNSTSGNVNLLPAPIQIEVKGLEVEAAFLSTTNVAAGTYTSIALNVSNPELTIRNDNNTAIAGVCAVGAICEFKPAAAGTFIYSGAPFPLTIGANSPSGLLVDVNLNSLITGVNTIDFTAAGAFVVTQLSAPGGTGQLEELEDIIGRISAVRSGEFDLQTFSAAQTRTLTIRHDATTMFEDFGDIGCAANNATCLVANLLVEVDARLMAGGALLARKIEPEDEDNDNEEELEGVVVDTSNLPASFDMVLVDEHINVTGLEVGNRVRVNVIPVTRFRVDADDLQISEQGNADFDSTTDLMVGQVVEVERQSPVAGTPPTFDSNRIKLKDTRVTGRVAAIDTVNNVVVLDTLPTLFGPSPATTLTVRVFAETRFHGPLTGIGGLAVGNTISVRGLLFETPGGSATPALFAKRIRRR